MNDEFIVTVCPVEELRPSAGDQEKVLAPEALRRVVLPSHMVTLLPVIVGRGFIKIVIVVSSVQEPLMAVRVIMNDE